MLVHYWLVVANVKDAVFADEDVVADVSFDDRLEFHQRDQLRYSVVVVDGYYFASEYDCSHYCPYQGSYHLDCAAVVVDHMVNSLNEKFDVAEFPFVGVAVEPECQVAWIRDENYIRVIYTVTHIVAVVDMLNVLDGAVDDEYIDWIAIALEVLGAVAVDAKAKFAVQLQRLSLLRLLAVATIESVAAVMSSLLVAAGVAVVMHAALAAETIPRHFPSI